MDSTLYHSLNQLLSDLTVAQRNVQILHWNLKSKDFIFLHEYFGELYATLSEYTDITAEQIRFMHAFPAATLKENLANSRLRSIESDCFYLAQESIEILISIIRYLKNLTDYIIAYADEHQQWDVVDVYSNQTAHYAKVLYFLENSLVD